MKKQLLLFASFLGLVAACAAPTQSSVPTPYPPEYLPTVIALTAGAANQAATETAMALFPTETPTIPPEPTITTTPFPTFTPTSIPGHKLGSVQFLNPGPMSKLISPIQLRMNVISGESQRVQIDLYGEDGRLLARELRKVFNTTEGAFMSVKISFETRAAAELGRITVSTLDKQGRIQALDSLRVLLLSTGVNEINPPGDPYEPVRVVKPKGDEAASDGVVSVQGDVWPYNLQPIVLELVNEEGKSLGLRILTIENIEPQLFQTTIPYRVTEPTSARLVIRQDDDRMPGVFYIYTQEILLTP